MTRPHAVAPFDGLLNFRDFGHGAVAKGVLFRSAALDRLSDRDLERLQALGIDLVIDLRRVAEHGAAPSRRWRGISAVIESSDAGPPLPPHDRYLAGDRLDYATLARRMADWYTEAPFDPEHQTLFRRGIEAVAGGHGSALVHCAAGKDRTGLFVMLLQHLLGVSEADQLAEYLRTNADRALAEHLNARLIDAAEVQGKRLEPSAAAGLSGVTETCFHEARAEMATRHGSIDGYLAAIGVGSDTRARLRQRLLRQTDTNTASSAIVTS